MAPVGRPTSYRPEYCEKVIELGKLGKSLAQFASNFNVARSTIDQWAEDYPEFSEALNKAKAHAQDWWENAGQEGMFLGGSGFNAAVWKTTVQARFRDDYTERSEVVTTATVNLKHSLTDMTDEELAAIATGSSTGATGKA